MVCKATVLGEPVPQGRPRFSRQGGFVKAYDPAKSRDYKAHVRMIAAKCAPASPTENAVVLEIRAYRSIPKSWSKKKRQAAMEGRLRPTTKPDASNVQKGIEDALNGLWYKDDSQIVAVTCGKWYSDRPRVEIRMEELMTEDGYNGAHYRDPTAEKAIAHKEREDKERLTAAVTKIKAICNVYGFTLAQRVVLVDCRTGQVYR